MQNENIPTPPDWNEPKKSEPVKTEETKTEPLKVHWRKLRNPDYLGSFDFQPNEERVVTVREVVTGTVKNAEGDSTCTIIHFMEPYKPMILNSTNGKMLEKLFETPFIEDWRGRSFKLIVKKIKAFGELVDALKVKNERVAKVLPLLELGSKKFIACKERYDKDKSVLAQIKQNYTLTAEVEKALTA